MPTTFVLTFCRIAIGFVFALSAGGKALDVRSFQGTISQLGGVTSRYSKLAAWAFVSAELAVVLLILLGQHTLIGGFVLAATLLAAFSFALAAALLRNKTIACNCFGRAERRISYYDLVRNALLIACAVVGVRAAANASGSISATEVVLATLMALTFVVLTLNIRDVSETLRQPFHAGER